MTIPQREENENTKMQFPEGLHGNGIIPHFPGNGTCQHP